METTRGGSVIQGCSSKALEGPESPAVKSVKSNVTPSNRYVKAEADDTRGIHPEHNDLAAAHKDLHGAVHLQGEEKIDPRINIIFNRIEKAVEGKIIPDIDVNRKEMEHLLKDNIHKLDSDEKGFIFEYKGKIFFISKPDETAIKIGVAAFKNLEVKSDHFARGGYVKVYEVSYLDSDEKGVMKVSRTKNEVLRDEQGEIVRDEEGKAVKTGKNESIEASEELRNEAKMMKDLYTLNLGQNINAVNSKIDGYFPM